MVTDKQAEQPVQVIPMMRSDVLSVLVLGGVVGLLVWAVGALLNHFVFESYFCDGDIVRQCGNSKSYAAVTASVIGGSVALAGLIRLRVYRPLLVLLASLFSTWGIVQMSWSMGWFTGILVAVVLYALAFGTYAWIARIREFWIAVVAVVILTVVVRLILVG